MQFLNNVQGAVDQVINDISNVAEEFAGNLPPAFGRGGQQQQPRRAHGWPFGNFNPQQSTNPQAQAPPPANANQQIPPASARAIRQLPTILVSPEDLVDENNRECCICMEPNCLGDKVTRLPCAHIFHSDCIVDWLRNHHCTCPICRYELQTDDPMFEVSRAERMKTRKPRYALYELQRMPIKELLALNKNCRVGIGEKKDLIQKLIDDERIDLIPAPEPVEYKLDDLKSMRVSELKKAMADAGVFFHAKDVIEKLDMITIFINSGRLSLLPSDIESESSSEQDTMIESKTDAILHDRPKDPVVETVDYDSESDEANENRKNSFAESPPQEMFPSFSATLNDHHVAEEAVSLPHIEANFSAKRDISEVISSSAPNDSSIVDAKRSALGKNASTSGESHASRSQDEVTPAPKGSVQNLSDTSLAIGSTNNETGFNSPLESEPTSGPSNVLDCQMELEQDFDEALPAPVTINARPCPLSGYNISQLKVMARDAKIDLSSCYERSEMVDILVSAGVTGDAIVGLSQSNFSGWSVSQLRAVASEVNVDLSQCSDRTEMVDRILYEANVERPHLQNYLRVLSPLMTSTLSQLRSTARQWDVNIGDCLETEEIIQRLITRANQFGVV